MNKKYIRQCQFCDEDVERSTDMQRPATCFDCKQIRNKLAHGRRGPITSVEQKIWSSMNKKHETKVL